jgi:DNA-binding response OmpR family regulator
MRIPGKHLSPVQGNQKPSGWRTGTLELLVEIDSLPVLVRLFVNDVRAEIRSEFASSEAHFRSLLEKMVARMRGSPLQLDASSRPTLATVEMIRSGDRLITKPAPPKTTVLRVGPLELDLIDRTARRSERQIDLRPQEYRLLRYMMQRSDQLLTRETLLKEVWQYKFVPKTNLVDVHMGQLRRKVDGSNDAPMIRTVRGAGFVLSTTPLLQDSTLNVSGALPK